MSPGNSLVIAADATILLMATGEEGMLTLGAIGAGNTHWHRTMVSNTADWLCGFGGLREGGGRQGKTGEVGTGQEEWRSSPRREAEPAIAVTATSPTLYFGLRALTCAASVSSGGWRSPIAGPTSFLGGRKQMSPSLEETLAASGGCHGFWRKQGWPFWHSCSSYRSLTI